MNFISIRELSRSDCVLSWRLSLLGSIFVLVSSQPGAGGEDRPPDCMPAMPVEATIVSIVDSQTVETARGVRVKLAAIEAPSAGIIIKGRKNMDPVSRARKLLRQLTLNKTVSLVFDASKPDRYGRRLAHILAPSSGKTTTTWVQAEMITRGLARSFPNTPDATCIKQLLKIETVARLNKTGLWNKRFYRVVQAENLKTLNRSLGRLQLIEGRVNSVSVRRTRTYINFSKDWGRDFTVTLNPRVDRLFSQSGINIKELAGKNIRVRGWLARHNGPTIKVYHVAQIEILEE